jgi:hypothetical protein
LAAAGVVVRIEGMVTSPGRLVGHAAVAARCRRQCLKQRNEHAMPQRPRAGRARWSPRRNLPPGVSRQRQNAAGL